MTCCMIRGVLRRRFLFLTWHVSAKSLFWKRTKTLEIKMNFFNLRDFKKKKKKKIDYRHVSDFPTTNYGESTRKGKEH